MSEQNNQTEVPTQENEELKAELVKLEDEINTLKQVLASKEQQASEMRTKLGITPLAQIKTTFENIGKSETISKITAKVQDAFQKENVVFERKNSIDWRDRAQKTQAALSEFGDNTGKAFASFGNTVSTKFSEMKSSPSFQSFEQKVGGIFNRNSQGATPTATTPSDPPKQDAPL